MKHKLLFLLAGSTLALQAHAEWFIRGSHNAWAADQMADIGSNTVIADNVVFTSDGFMKFDRLGDWSENYGIGGLNGGDIPVSTGTWDIEFYTDSKDWKILDAATHGDTQFHFRGTPNNWVEGTIMTPVGAQANLVETCQDFTDNTNPRFKIDPNGGWGGDEFPGEDVVVDPAWTRIVVNTATSSIAAVIQNLSENCGEVQDSDGDGVPDTLDQCPDTPAGVPVDADGCEIISEVQYHLRGTANGWAENTLLTPISGSSEYEICINFTGGDADGGPRFKIDPNGGWGEDAFPAEDFQVNTGFARIVVDSADNSIASVEDGLGADCSEPEPDFRSRSIYFVFVDRFQNGDPTNDNGNNAAGTSTIKSAGDKSEWRKYWGGDIQGLIDRLDYLEALGISAIWVTPLMDNIDDGPEGPYHGYWARDFFAVDEHMGDWALVDQLDEEMEARGMKLVLDIALNHSNPNHFGEFGALYRDGEFITDFAGDNGTWYHNNGVISDCSDNDPTTWDCGWEWDSPWHMRNKELFNLSDFNHGIDQNSIADQYLIDSALLWMEHGVDAFRIDAIKHIEPNFMNRFAEAVRAVNPDAYIFGEWFGAGVGNDASMAFLNENRGSELLDFGLRNTIESAIADDVDMVALNEHIESRPGIMGGREDWQPIFLDNHDDTRTSVFLQADGPVSQGRQGKNMNVAFAEARQNLGMALVMTLPGIPTIYYGSEQNSTWFDADPNGGAQGADPWNREQMPSFSQDKPAFAIISALAELRKNSPAIAKGTYTQKWVNENILVFERNEGDDAVVVAVNKGPTRTVNVSALGLADGSYTSVVGSDIVNVSGGEATLQLDQNEIIVLR